MPRCYVGEYVMDVLCQDTVIYERLVGAQPFKDTTTQHLQDFAVLGLSNLLPSEIFCRHRERACHMMCYLKVKLWFGCNKILLLFRCFFA